MRPSFWVSAYVRLSYVLFQASGRVNLAFGLVHESLGKWLPGFPSTFFFWPHFSMVFSWRSSEWAHALHVFGMLRKPATWWMCQDVGMWALRPGLNEYTVCRGYPEDAWTFTVNVYVDVYLDLPFWAPNGSKKTPQLNQKVLESDWIRWFEGNDQVSNGQKPARLV